MKSRRSTLVVLSFCTAFVLLQSVFAGAGKPKRPLPAGAEADEACRPCHVDVFTQYCNSAHALTTQPATAAAVLGPFAAPRNRLALNRRDALRADSSEGFFYQAWLRDGRMERREKADYIIGSGTRGQSFLYWKGDSLFQLPLTWFTRSRAWVSSPGFPDTLPYFNRPVNTVCLECHATYAQGKNGTNAVPSITYEPASVVTGISCSRCHGRGAEHIRFHEENPSERKGRYILNSKKFGLLAQLDACGQCHSGARQPRKAPFTFEPGTRLDQYSQSLSGTGPGLDVHGNQSGLLQSSRCFQESRTLTCITCHDAHKTEKSTAVFSARCQQCHQPGSTHFCPLQKQLGERILANCIDCHMPPTDSRALLVTGKGGVSTALRVHNHRIAIYPVDPTLLRSFLKSPVK